MAYNTITLKLELCTPANEEGSFPDGVLTEEAS